MNNKQIRIANLLAQIELAGSIVALADKLDVKPTYITQLKTGFRGMGDRTARKFEAALGLPNGAFDVAPAGADAEMLLATTLQKASEQEVMAVLSQIVDQLSDDAARNLANQVLARLAQNRPQEK